MSAPEISRRQAWLKFAVLIVDGAPDPRDIVFFPYEPRREYSQAMVDVVVDDAAALWWWTDRFGGKLDDPAVMEHNGRWRQTATAEWHGYHVTVKTYDASTLGQPSGLAAVRALADQDITRDGGEVAGPEVAGPATAPEHYHVGGTAGGPGENDAECACGVVYAGFDTHAEATAALGQHVANPQPNDVEPEG